MSFFLPEEVFQTKSVFFRPFGALCRPLRDSVFNSLVIQHFHAGLSYAAASRLLNHATS